MTRLALSLLTLLPFLMLAGCGDEVAGGPPTVRLGEDVCDLCDMIISDERFATATIIEGERGPEPILFDDFNCQINYEREHPDLVVLERWVHDHATLAWLPADAATYLRSDTLHTPMASGIAAFTDRAGAEALQQKVEGEVLTDEALRRGTE